MRGARWLGESKYLCAHFLRPSQAGWRLKRMKRRPKLVSAHSLAVFARVTGEDWMVVEGWRMESWGGRGLEAESVFVFGGDGGPGRAAQSLLGDAAANSKPSANQRQL